MVLMKLIYQEITKPIKVIKFSNIRFTGDTSKTKRQKH